MATNKEKKVDESIVDEIQLKDLEYRARKNVLDAFVERNLNSDKDIAKSPTYQGMMKDVAKAQQEFEKAKREVIKKIFPDKKERDKIGEWNLNYSNCVITYTEV